jgi:hypothetical protein
MANTRGLLDQPVPTLKEQQEPQAPMDRHDTGYDNQVPIDSWLRGGGPGQATDKPNFDKHKAGR